ncbi:MAG: glycosyltransferase family 4 protein [Methanobacteriota archaeon]|nr:MAG: glycosyltransferase family 4 protein [Euryarchaeota archaeon]
MELTALGPCEIWSVVGFILTKICICGLAASLSGRLSILLTSDSFYPPKGGGDLSLRILARHLSERGHSVGVAYFGRADPDFATTALDYPFPVRGLWPRHMVIRRILNRNLKKALDEHNPDVVITQQMALSPTVDASHERGIPVIVLLRGVDLLCLGSFWSGAEKRCDYRCIGCEDAGCMLVQYPLFRREITRIRSSLRLAEVVVSNSEYTRRTLRSIVGVESYVLNPPVERVAEGGRVRESGSVLFVSPVRHKGVDIAIELSRRLKNEHFIFAGRTRKSIAREIGRLSNVDYIPWVLDMGSCYSASKLVIVPSVIPEGYGRVCAEAQSHGLPCAVSAIGALPETVGDAGDVVQNHRDVDSWVEVVGRYSDPDYVREKSQKALAKASDLTTHDEHTAAIEALIKNLIANRRT